MADKFWKLARYKDWQRVKTDKMLAEKNKMPKEKILMLAEEF